MKSLYIIGNGFDIAHGLDTKYWSLRTYLAENHPEFLGLFEAMYNIGCIDDADPRVTPEMIKKWENSVDIALWSTFEDKMGTPDFIDMMNTSQCVLEDLNLDGGNVGIRYHMDLYWKDQYGFINELPEYVSEWIEQVDTTDLKCKKKSLIGSQDYFLCFNYTDTLERVYNIENVCHIHGSVKSIAAGDPIMGHCNKHGIEEYSRNAEKADNEFSEGEASIQEAIANYLASSFKDTEDIIELHSDFFSKLNEVNQIIVFGCSVGPGDRPYFLHIADNVSDDAKWIVYYHGDSEEQLKEFFLSAGIEDRFSVEYHQSDEFWE